MIGVYQITCISNNKIYIGSSINVESRLKAHRWLLNNNKHHSQHLQNTYNKYGGENFKVSLLEKCTLENLLEREQYYLDTLLKASDYKNNISNYFIEKSLNICPLSVKGFTGNHKRESILKSLKSRGLSEIYQINDKGEILQIFETIKDISDKLNIVLTTICRSIRNKALISNKNFGFIRADRYTKGFIPKKYKLGVTKGSEYNSGTELYVYDVYNRFYKKFNKIKDAALYFNTTSASICKKLNIQRNSLIGETNIINYSFYTSSQNLKENILKFDNILGNIKVFTVFDEFVGYSTIKELSEKLGVTKSAINEVLKNRRNQCKKYKFKIRNYNEDIV